MMISPGGFFIKIMIVKGQKIAQNDRKCCLSHSISQEPYIISASFLVHKCKMLIAPGVLFIFTKF